VWFGEVPHPLRALLRTDGANGTALYASTHDVRSALQAAWLSTPGMRTHTHFDNDHNFFVQLVGRKRFVLWPPNQTDRLCPYPRLHPLWHKSRMPFEAASKRTPDPPTPDPPTPGAASACREYASSEAIGVDVSAGDVLYLPPFYWHTVETLTPSLSLSTLSRYPQLYNHMNALYTHEHLFDSLRPHEARTYALIAYISELTRRAGQPDLIRRLVGQYAGLEGGFPPPHPNRTRPFRCALDARGTPLCRSCLERVRFDATMGWEEHLAHLPEDVVRVVLPEFVEELTQQVVGSGEALRFWTACFLEAGGPRFFLTRAGTEEHRRLWIMTDRPSEPHSARAL
jgi:hypothetical protein